MSAVAVLVADGFETIECLTMVDVLRRGGVRAMLVSIMATREAVSSQQVNIVCDATLDEVDMNEFDYIVLPGGMPGTTNLGRDQRVCELVREFAANKHVAAICAAPSILGDLGCLLVAKQRASPALSRPSRRAPMPVARPLSWTAISSPPPPWGKHCPSPSPCWATSPASAPSRRCARAFSYDSGLTIAPSYRTYARGGI